MKTGMNNQINHSYTLSRMRLCGMNPSKKLGQNFLINDFVLQDIVEDAGIQPGEAVMEIGPGLGNLTRYLAPAADLVLAIEKDERVRPALSVLSREFDNIRYEIADFLQYDFVSALQNFPNYRVVANVPYYITGKIIQTLLRAKRRPQSITILVQKEVAENICASVGEMNLLALSVQLVGLPEIKRYVPARDFYPEPKVDSAVVHITIPEIPPYTDYDGAMLFRVARACFAGKRKQIHNTLVNNLHLTSDQVETVLKEIQVDRTVRPQQLSVLQWINLSKLVAKLL